MKFRKLQQKKTYQTWLASYLIIIAVAVLCSAVFHILLTNVINRTVGQANEKVLHDIKMTMDFYIEDMRNLAAELSYSSAVDSLMSAQGEGEYIYYAEQLKNELGNYKVLNTKIDNIYIYSARHDSVISPERVASSDLLYEINYGGGADAPVTREEWMQLFVPGQKMRLFSFPLSDAYQQVEETLVLTQTLPGYWKEDLVLLISLNPDIISDLLEDDILFHECYLYLLDRENNIILTNGESIDMSAVQVPDRASASVTEQKINGITFVTSGETSDYLGLKYVFMVPKTEYYRTPNLVRNISFLSILVFLIVGLLVSFRLLKKNYQPLRDLLNYIDSLRVMSADDTVAADEKNEFTIFKNAVSNIVSEKQSTQNKLEKQEETVRKTLLYNILTGRSVGDFQVDDIMLAYDVNFTGENFIVLIYYIEEFAELFEGTEQEADEQIQLVLLVIKNITKELLDQEFENIYTEVDDMNVCLINTEQEEYQKNLEKIKAIIQQAQQIIRENFYIEFTAAVSQQHSGTGGITVAYQEAMEVLSYRMMTGKKGIICYDEISAKDDDYSYSLETEISLIEAIRAGNQVQAAEIVTQIFEAHFQPDVLTLEAAKCLTMDIASTLLKVTHELQRNYHIDCANETALLRKILMNESDGDTKETIMSITQRLCLAVGDKKASGGSRTIELVKKYINQNYADLNLSLNSIADELNVSHTYLSRIFKLQTGEGVLQYINSRRLNEAKHLLSDTNFNIVEIARKVGYANSNTFIRSFKKYNGITPGKYREMASFAEE